MKEILRLAGCYIMLTLPLQICFWTGLIVLIEEEVKKHVFGSN